jgi:hypothetical protein
MPGAWTAGQMLLRIRSHPRDALSAFGALWIERNASKGRLKLSDAGRATLGARAGYIKAE